ncbi:MAG TPA: hypothetical protein VJ824_15955 [Bacillota bacterium]|nr:hypothetical protein [Bacillota bacterium]
MQRKSKYILSYVGAIVILIGIYFMTQAEAKGTAAKGIFATQNLPPGSLITESDVVLKDGVVLDQEKNLLETGDINHLIGKKVTSYGIRMDRPVLKADIVDPEDKSLQEIKLVGDITIPEEAKIVDIALIYDERNFPGKGKETLAANVPVKMIYNNQNIPINSSEAKGNKVPKAISVMVNETQMNKILNKKNMGTLYFTTAP